jgi:leucyl-tRNA synthetase
MLSSEDGEKMSKSKGNVVLPETVSDVYGIDTARLFLCGLASPDKDIAWSEKGIVGSLKFVNKIFDYFEKVKSGKTSEKVEAKLNKTIKNVTKYFGDFQYRKASIEIRELFNLIYEQETIEKKVLEKFLKILNPICPHITEELWEKLKNKSFISLEKWPEVNMKKANKEIANSEKFVEKLKEDITNIKKILAKKDAKVYVYVLPNELEIYQDMKDVQVYAVNDKKKYDPENKSKKVKPNRPGIYLE